MYWILPTDKLPPHGVDVLVTLATGRGGLKRRVAVGAWWDAHGRGHCGEAGWSVDGDDIKPPLAWMDLPLPFNAGNDPRSRVD